MKFLVVTFAPTLIRNGLFVSYAPYVKEMNIWFKHCDEIVIASPTIYNKTILEGVFYNQNINVVSIPWISFDNVKNIFKAILSLPIICYKLFKEMRKADHIHLRCPGTISLIGCVIQIFFPHKIKTAKYAGNWDSNSKQPSIYRIQKWILSNTFLTKNMSILVYGDWPNQSKNVKSFFTASYYKKEFQNENLRLFNTPHTFLFVGSLVGGKRPFYAIKLIEKLSNKGISCTLTLYGDGVDRLILENYVRNNELEHMIFFKGNRSAVEVKEAYKTSQFLLLPSKSEGWPKVVAEAMFWGAIPIVTPVSCVPWMLNYETRGLLINVNLEEDTNKLIKLLNDKHKLNKTSKLAQSWSKKYTIDLFDLEIKKLLK